MDSVLEKRSSTSEEQSLSSLEKRRRVNDAVVSEVQEGLEGALVLADRHHGEYDGYQQQQQHQQQQQQQQKYSHGSSDNTNTNNNYNQEQELEESSEEYEEDMPVLCAEEDEVVPVGIDLGRHNSRPRSRHNKPAPKKKASALNNAADMQLISSLFLDELPKDDPKEVARALEKLGSIIKHNQGAASQAFALGGHSVLVLTMRQWPHYEPIQRHACHCIFRMIGDYKQIQQQQQQQQPQPSEQELLKKQAQSSSSSAPIIAPKLDLIDSFLVMGVIDEILIALRTFPESSELFVFGLGAMGNLLGGEAPSRTRRAAARSFVKEARGVALVADGMRMFPDHAKLQELGCWLCACLCLVLGKSSARVMKYEALLAVSMAVQNYPDHRAIDKQASCFMASLFRLKKTSRS